MRKMPAAATLLLLALSACKKESSVGALAAPQPSSGIAAERAVASRSPSSLSSAATADAAVPATPPRIARMIVRTATVSMVVGDTLGVIDRVTATVEASGGYVNDSKIWREGELTRATLALRVPSAKLLPTLAAVRRLAVRVQSEAVSSEEVTQEYVDLASQLRNDEAAEVELRQLMTEIRQRAKKADDVLQIHEQLRTIRASIEKTKGRMQYLEQMSSDSTINLELVPDAIAKPVVAPGWQPIVIAKDAGRALVGVMQSFAAAANWIVIYVLPIVLVLFVGAAMGWQILAMLKRRVGAAKLP
jgi:hypothetical protein